VNLPVRIDENIMTLCQGRAVFRTVVLLGGVSIRPQIDQIRRGVDIVIATPGRLLDVIEHRALRLDKVRALCARRRSRSRARHGLHAIDRADR
jgi:ATP-dependent RNA helicase RhlE